MSAVLKPLSGFRPVKEEDIERILQIENAAYEFPWTKGLLQDCMRGQYFFCAMVEQNDIIGYGIMSCAVEEAHILNICIHPEFQGQGFGYRLLQHLLDIARRHKAETAFLEVRASNLKAQELYENAGFNQLGLRKGYYPAGGLREDALLFAKTLI